MISFSCIKQATFLCAYQYLDACEILFAFIHARDSGMVDKRSEEKQPAGFIEILFTDYGRMERKYAFGARLVDCRYRSLSFPRCSP